MEELFLVMDDTENEIKNVRPLTEEDDLLLLEIAKKFNHTFEPGSPLDNLSKKYSLQKKV